MKRVTIHSIWSKKSRTDRAFTYTVELPDGTTVMETLENAYCLTNTDDRPRGAEVPATSPGDIILADGQHWMVELMGYHKITATEATWIVQNCTSRDVFLGYQTLVNSGAMKGSLV